MISFAAIARAIGPLALICPSLVACTGEGDGGRGADDEAQAAGGGYRIAETFQVGRGVYVRALAVDAGRNVLWVGTSVGALEIDLGSGERLATYTRDNALANEYVFAAMVGANGDVWLGTNGGGVSRRQAGRWQTYFPLHGLADYWVYAFAEQGEDVWIGTWAGLNRFTPATGEFRTYLKELVNEWVYGLAVDSRGHLWVGTEGGVNRFDGETWATWTHADGLGAANEAGLPASPNTGLGTRSRHDLGVTVAGRATYNPNYVFALLADPEDRIWAGTWGGGVSRFDGRAWRNYTTGDGLAGDIVYALAHDGEALWAGTSGGLSRFQEGRWGNWGVAEGLSDAHVYAVAVAPSGDVWAGTRGAVNRLVKR